MSLFDQSVATSPSNRRDIPLPERMRPRTLDEFAGQQHLIGPGKPLRLAIERGEPGSMIFWGPPGTGKTTLAKIIANTTNANFVEFSAVTSGIKEIKQVMSDAEHAAARGVRTILFIDEIHRFNKAQQDAFLPYVERGAIRLIGATTENPSFEINAALLSRARVYVLQSIADEAIVTLLQRALSDEERGLGTLNIQAEGGALQSIAAFANGDARYALNALETASLLLTGRGETTLTREAVADALQQRTLLYDKNGEQHYDLISALHKSVRNSDVDASLYWLRRMLAAGEDPMYVARRIVRMAVEDIGLAAPEALNLTLSAQQAMHLLGSPEGELALAQAVVYLALAPKSNAVYTAFNETAADVNATGAQPVPLHLRNAPTRLMKDLGYAKNYQYAHDLPGKVAAMQCMPDGLEERRYYHPTNQGREKLLAQRMDEITHAKAEAQQTLKQQKVSRKTPEN